MTFRTINIFLVLLLFYWGCVSNSGARKKIHVRVKDGSKIIRLALEDYVAQVVAAEMNPSWPLEALKAQAVAARTFALKRMTERKNKPFHLNNSVMDQVASDKESPRAVLATKQTRGLVLVHKNKLAEPSFHSTCGGKTSEAQYVWGQSHSHLKSVNCNYCQNSPTFKWQALISKRQLNKVFGQKISQLKIKSRSPEGRINKLELRGRKNIVLSGQKFRIAVGSMLMKSTYRSAEQMPASFSIVCMSTTCRRSR